MMSPQPSADRKLTKKQRKTLAFRERKGNKAGEEKDVDQEGENEAGDIPILEIQDEIDPEVVSVDAAKTVSKDKVTGPADAAKVAKKKRKREAGDEINENGGEGGSPVKAKKSKKSKKDVGEVAEGEGEGEGDEASKGSSKTKQRFILFVGEYIFRPVNCTAL